VAVARRRGRPWRGDDIREHADRLAAAGYMAFAPDLYSRPRLRCVLAMLSAYRSGEGRRYRLGP
jgi:dienelactone hydrolase